MTLPHPSSSSSRKALRLRGAVAELGDARERLDGADAIRVDLTVHGEQRVAAVAARGYPEQLDARHLEAVG